ncbi:MAG: DUF1883 domain-containing protein [Candidatus Zixiibacteriota bacterium]
MRYLRYEFDAGPDDVIEVSLDKQANVILLDRVNYQGFRAGRRYKYYGGLATRSPFRLSPPHYGHWYVVVHRGGYPGSVRASARLITY